MMYCELRNISQCDISYDAYKKVFEPMYMATDMNKYDFIHMMLPSLKVWAKEEERERRNKAV